MSVLRIALTMRVVDAVGYYEPRDAISHDWVRLLEGQGMAAYPIPNATSDPQRYLQAVDGIIFTGGNDFVAAEGECSLSELRNESELRLLDCAIRQSLPVLGVCRGLHVINHYFGGRVTAKIDQTKVNHVALNHPVSLTSPFAELGTDRIVTNSFHQQGVMPDDVSTDVIPFARSEPDGVIEGLFHPQKPLLAMQWHPERENPARAFDELLIGRLFRQGAFWRK